VKAAMSNITAKLKAVCESEYVCYVR